MADVGGATIKGQGQVRVPEAVRRRWGLQDGDLVTYVDLGDAMTILPGGTDVLRRSLLNSTSDGDEDRPSQSIHSIEPRRWPPDSGGSFRLEVDGDAWEVPWGRHDEFGTAAYWVDQTIVGGYADEYEAMDPLTAVVWGLLHGGGIKAESGNAFLEPVMALLERQRTPTAEAVEAVLRTPTGDVGRYRFPRIRGGYIAAAVDRLRRDPPPDDPERFRRYLLDLRGVGPKTAALIVSGVTGGDAAVHINDIWLRRALVPAGVFRPEWQVDHDYDRFEDAFLQYARHGNVTPGALDWCIWELAREGTTANA